MEQKEKDVLWYAIRARIPEGSNFVCFVQEGVTEGTMIGTLSPVQTIEFLTGTLAALVKMCKGAGGCARRPGNE